MLCVFLIRHGSRTHIPINWWSECAAHQEYYNGVTCVHPEARRREKSRKIFSLLAMSDAEHVRILLSWLLKILHVCDLHEAAKLFPCVCRAAAFHPERCNWKINFSASACARVCGYWKIKSKQKVAIAFN